MSLNICMIIYFSLSHRYTSSRLTFFLLLGHDCVAEGQQSEEGVDLGVLQLHCLHQGVIVECEARVGKWVEGEIHFICILARSRGEERREGPKKQKDKGREIKDFF